MSKNKYPHTPIPKAEPIPTAPEPQPVVRSNALTEEELFGLPVEPIHDPSVVGGLALGPVKRPYNRRCSKCQGEVPFSMVACPVCVPARAPVKVENSSLPKPVHAFNPCNPLNR